MNEDGTMAKGQDLFNFAKKHKLKIGKIEDLIAYRLKKEKLIKLKKQSKIDVKNQKYNIRIYENLLDGSEHFALIKGKIKKGITPRVRVISSNIVQNYLINQKLPNSFLLTSSERTVPRPPRVASLINLTPELEFNTCSIILFNGAQSLSI